MPFGLPLLPRGSATSHPTAPEPVAAPSKSSRVRVVRFLPPRTNSRADESETSNVQPRLSHPLPLATVPKSPPTTAVSLLTNQTTSTSDPFPLDRIPHQARTTRPTSAIISTPSPPPLTTAVPTMAASSTYSNSVVKMRTKKRPKTADAGSYTSFADLWSIPPGLLEDQLLRKERELTDDGKENDSPFASGFPQEASPTAPDSFLHAFPRPCRSSVEVSARLATAQHYRTNSAPSSTFVGPTTSSPRRGSPPVSPSVQAISRFVEPVDSTNARPAFHRTKTDPGLDSDGSRLSTFGYTTALRRRQDSS
ncbi:hypothetical protein JCM10212_004584 [Sporobolomyces blumeae]